MEHELLHTRRNNQKDVTTINMVDFLRKRYDNCNDSNQKIEDLTYAGSIADLEPPGADGRLAPVVCRHERPTIEALR